MSIRTSRRMREARALRMAAPAADVVPPDDFSLAAGVPSLPAVLAPGAEDAPSPLSTLPSRNRFSRRKALRRSSRCLSRSSRSRARCSRRCFRRAASSSDPSGSLASARSSLSCVGCERERQGEKCGRSALGFGFPVSLYHIPAVVQVNSVRRKEKTRRGKRASQVYAVMNSFATD